MIPKPTYAFFDFDGTLISCDSLRVVLRTGFQKRPWAFLFLFIFSPIFIATILFRIDKRFAKSALLWSITVGMKKKDQILFLRSTPFRQASHTWFRDATTCLQKLQEKNIQIVVVSASPALWIRPFLKHYFGPVRMTIGSRLGFFWGGVVLTSQNCYKAEKLTRIRESLGEDFVWHSSWSDHVADMPLLSCANEKYVVCPTDAHRLIFKKNMDFEELTWRTLNEQE
jgi:phosphatidylglycerophosphatase C